MKRKKSLLIAKQNEALPLSFLTKAREKKMTKKIKFIFVKSEEIKCSSVGASLEWYKHHRILCKDVKV